MNNILEPCFGYDTLRMSVNVNHSDRETICDVANFKPYSYGYKANLRNLDLFLSDTRLSVSGSFPKFLTGENNKYKKTNNFKIKQNL